MKLKNFVANDWPKIFQDPLTSLNPYLTIARQLTEVLEVHEASHRQLHDGHQLRCWSELVFQMLLSGSTNIRINFLVACGSSDDCHGIVMWTGSPFANEPTAAQCVLIKAQILELIKDLQTAIGVAYRPCA